MNRTASGSGLVLGFALLACGGATPPPDAPAPAASPAASTGAPPAPAPAPATPVASAAPGDTPAAVAAASAPSAPSAAWSDPNEKPDGYELPALFDKKRSKVSFPKKTADDAQCWTTVGATGEHDKDFQAIVAACGTPTGLVEYAKPIEGKLHHEHDPRDIYKLKVLSNYCYRYFAVADNGIKDLDLLIEKPGGALVGDDKTTSPVAIIETDKPWCQDEDQTLEFHVEVKAGSSDTGGYVLGVWARPKH